MTNVQLRPLANKPDERVLLLSEWSPLPGPEGSQAGPVGLPLPRWADLPKKTREIIQHLMKAGLVQESTGENKQARWALTRAGADLLAAHRRNGGQAPATRPTWQDGVLRLRDQVVKDFLHEAPNQKCVLDAFEEAGWPVRLWAPIEGKRLRWQTLDSLNRCQQGPRRIKFHAVDRGWIKWEEVAAED